MSVKNPKTP